MNFFKQPSKYAALSDETEPIIFSDLEKTTQCDSGGQKLYATLNEFWKIYRSSIFKTILCLSLVIMSAGLGALWAKSQQQVHMEEPRTVVPDGEHYFPLFAYCKTTKGKKKSLIRIPDSAICLPTVRTR